MKIIVMGTNHAGTSFVRTLANLKKEHEITAYDKNTNISFLGCGIALWVSDEFEDSNGLFYSSPQELESMGINVKMEHEIIEVNSKEKFVMVKNLKTGEIFKDEFDKLIYSAGTWPIVPPIKGIDKGNIFLSKLFQHAQIIKKKAKDDSVKDVVVVGAGYIGIELVEAFAKAGKKVTLIDMANRVTPAYFDEEFTNPLQERMIKAGVELRMGETVKEFKGSENIEFVVTEKGEYKADLVILSIGFKPLTKLVEGQLELEQRSKSILVNEFQQTSNPDIYAIGDSASLMHNSTGKHSHVALATNAVKTGLVAAYHVAGIELPFPGVQGTSGINIFGCKYASTGISEAFCKKNNIEAKSVFWKDADRPEWMSSVEDVQIKIVYNPKTLRLLGAQIGSFGKNNHSEAIFMLSLAIQKGMTLPEIALIDVYFLPHYNKPFNFILQALLNGINKA
ncbi:FAD-dependent oxidoreductase [Mycoplasma todarodis]|uniref:NADH oxidase n=1 Tax=Mycoplasma todarodis TaxID=1937191 RepID=A0A4V2NHZ6_9MOLU|nr:FAD-dependent oxidoreductase [Mycoplasma todarodis]TCG10748.1 NADH oxidase [Mycoplasma todarodis]